MIPSRGLAALIWGVVVLIAIQLVPTTARAHAGHAHVSAAQVSGAVCAGIEFGRHARSRVRPCNLSEDIRRKPRGRNGGTGQ